MSHQAQNIAKNTTWLTISYIGQKLFAFIYFTIIARILGASNIGQYVFAISFTTILSVFIDFGLSQVLIRESAKYLEKANIYLNNILTIKIFLSAITYLAAIIIINILNKPALTLNMVYLAGVIMIFDSFTLSFWAIFRAYQNLKFESISIIINQILIVSVGLISVLLKFPLYFLVIALFSGCIFSFFYSLILLKTKLNFKFQFQWNKEIVKLLLKIAFPFALAAIFTRIYTFIDQVLLSVLIGDQSVGWYSVAYKITYALQFVPAAFAAAIYPAMSNYFLYDNSKLKQIFEKSMFFLIIISLPIAFGLTALADKIIIGFYGTGYQPSILTLRIFIFAVISLFLSYPVGSLLNACNKQTINTINMGVTMVLNIILHIILIPKFQHIGAAIATLISLSLLFILNLIWVPKIIKYDFKFLLVKAGKAIFASLIMFLFILYAKQSINYLVLVVLGALIYTGILYLIKGFTKEDIKYLWQAVFKKPAILPSEET
ncbi:MAG: oligosaccharide flippase family protein, partial [Candidatus Parcubacteria bacterium]|nr:oligosaccharide flippase family protein [Candidatus Parcubacteria bacterium]